jgi:hypothetical protein
MAAFKYIAGALLHCIETSNHILSDKVLQANKLLQRHLICYECIGTGRRIQSSEADKHPTHTLMQTLQLYARRELSAPV